MKREEIKMALILIILVPHSFLIQVAYVVTWGLEACIAWVGEKYRRIREGRER